MSVKPRLTAALALIAAVGATVLVFALAADQHGYWLPGGLALIWFLSAWSLSGGVPEGRWLDSPVAPSVPVVRGWQRGVGVGLLGAGFAIGAWAIPSCFRTWQTLLPIWVLCLALVLTGAAVLGRIGRPGAAPVSSLGVRCLHGALFVGCLLIGAGFRLYRLQQMPPGVWVDETNIALDALMILDGRPDSPFWVGWWETPTLYAYYMAALFKLFGVTFWGLRAASLLPAILSVAAIYPVGRLLFGPRAALIGMFLFAVSGWHVTMSRWGFNELMPPLFQLAATALLLLGLRTQKALHFVLAGLTLGLGMYTYLASRLVVGVLGAYLLYRIVFERGFLRRQVVGLTLFGLTFLLTFGPLIMTYAQSWFALLNRSSQISIFLDVRRAGNWWPLFENLKRHLLMFHVRGDANLRHNIPQRPMLTLLPGVLLILGAGLTMRRIRDHRFVLLLVWVLITLQGGILSTLNEGPQAYRTIGVVPALCLLGGVTADAWVRVVGWSPLVEATALGALLAALSGDAVTVYRRYFVEHQNMPSIDTVFSELENAIARRLLAERAESQSLSHVYLTPRFYYFAPVRYFLYTPRHDGQGGVDNPEFHVIEPQTDLPLSVERSRDLLLLLELDVGPTLELLRRLYPHLSVQVVSDRERLYTEVHIPKEDLSAIQGLQMRDPAGTPRVGVENLNAQLSALRPGDYLTGSFRAPRSGWYGFTVAGPAALDIDGARFSGYTFLGQGLHDLRVTRVAGDGPLAVMVEPPGGTSGPLDVRQLFRLAAPRQGFRGRYYAGKDWQGAPVFERIDPVLVFAWPGEEPLPDPFSVRWDGRVKIQEPGDYTFEAQCDDGCALSIDGEQVGSGLEVGMNVVRAIRRLESGTHEIAISYFQNGGGKGFRLVWRPPGGPQEPIAAGLVTPLPLGQPRMSATRPDKG